MQHENKPFAPFGAVFYQLCQSSVKISFTVFLYVGKDAVKEARSSLAKGQIALCLPHPKSMSDYRWSLAGKKVIIYNTGSMSELGLLKISHGVLSHGASIAAVYSEETGVKLHKLKKELKL